MRLGSIVTVSLLLVVLFGCVPAQERNAGEIRYREAERARQECAAALQSQTASAAQQLQSQERKTAAAQAEASALRARVEALQREYDELVALIESRASERLERPVVSTAVLPAALDERLQEFAKKYQHRVWYDQSRGAVSFANDKLFESGSDAVRPDAQAALHELAGLATQSLPADFELVVVGHTDDTPIKKDETLARHPTNWHLSVHRAIAVKSVLVKAGLPAAQLGVMGYGAHRPAGGDRARNRRVEVFFVPRGTVQPIQPVTAPRH